MAEPALNWEGLSNAQKVADARAKVLAMTGNVNFTAPNPVPNPSLASISTAATAVESADTDVINNGGGKKWTNIAATKVATLDKLMAQLTKYVANTANGNSTIIQSAGYDLEKSPTKSTKLMVTNLSAKPGNGEGDVNLKWKSLRRKASSYKAYISDDVTPKVWKEFTGNTNTKAKLSITDLPSGEKKWFSVTPINPAGEGDLSDPGYLQGAGR